MLITLLMRAGLGLKAAKVAACAILILAVFGALLWWGRTKYQAGVDDTDAKWKAASAKLERQVVRSAAAADVPAAVRVEEFTTKVEAEKEKLDEAERNGSSPLDVLFGPSGV